MLTKVEPFEDKFNDTNFTGWTPLNSSWWQVVDGKLTTVVQSWTHVMEKQFSDADHELQFDYINKNTSNNSYGISAALRQASAGGRVAVTFFPNRAELSEYVPGTGWVVRATDTGATTTQDATYHVKGVCDGASVKVWRWQDGEMPAQVFSYTTAYTDSWRIYFSTPAYSNFAIDNVRILADDLSTTSTFTVNDADELVSMADTNGGTTYFEYDAWGRMSRKYLGASGSPTFEATYEYKYDDKLVAVESNFPDEGDVSYEYGADGQRRSRTADGVTTKYNWAGDGRLNEEDDSGTIVRSFVGNGGQIDGAIPSTGAYTFNFHDATTSLRQTLGDQLDQQRNIVYAPFGERLIEESIIGVDATFNTYIWDQTAQIYLAYYRGYDPVLARWTTPEPTGADGNLYWFSANNPSSCYDADGLFVETLWDLSFLAYDMACGSWYDVGFDVLAILIPFVPAGLNKAYKATRNIRRVKSVGPIKGYTKHGINQAISREGTGVHPSAILDAVKNPQKVVPGDGGVVVYKGRDASVVLNNEGKVISTYPKNRKGRRACRL